MIGICEKTASQLYQECKQLVHEQEILLIDVKLGNGKTEEDLIDSRRISNNKLREYFEADEREAWFKDCEEARSEKH